MSKKERKLDLCCGPNKRGQDWIGMDYWPFDGVDIVRDVRRGIPFDDSTVGQVWCSQCLEHFNGEDLIFIVEEVWRVLKNKGRFEVLVPNRESPNNGKDFTHKKIDWDNYSFQMWEKKDGEYVIERGPGYMIQGEFRVLDLNRDSTGNGDQYYSLEAVK